MGVVQNGLSLHVCMFVLLGSARKNDMPCYFVSSGQPKPSLPHFFGMERPYLHHISLVYREAKKCDANISKKNLLLTAWHPQGG